jgi:endonuclease/exonuclease/phosphatase family metal-dependent hydrolase
MANIKIITINTWKCDGEYHLRMQLLAQQLQLLKPDIIVCQECFVSEDDDTSTLKFLAAQLGMNYLFLPGRYKKRYLDQKLVNSFSGLGILSVFPLKEINNFNLPVVPEDDDRKAQQVEISIPGAYKLLVTNIHFTHLKNATELRKTQAEFVANKASLLSEYRYKIVCGDFNAQTGSPEIAAFINIAQAVDCYVAGNGKEPAYSLAEALAANRHICVDHIFAFPFPGEKVYPQFVNSAIVLNEPDKATGLYPSDHFGISTTLIIN